MYPGLERVLLDLMLILLFHLYIQSMDDLEHILIVVYIVAL